MRTKLQEEVIDESYYDLFDVVHGKQDDKNQETQQEKNQLEVPSFLKSYKEKKLTNDDYVEVVSDNYWVESKD